MKVKIKITKKSTKLSITDGTCDDVIHIINKTNNTVRMIQKGIMITDPDAFDPRLLIPAGAGNDG